MERAQQPQHSRNLSDRSHTQPEKGTSWKGNFAITPKHIPLINLSSNQSSNTKTTRMRSRTNQTLSSAKAPYYGLTKTKMGNNLLMHQCHNYAHSSQQAELLRISLKHFPPFPCLTHPHTTSTTHYISCTFGSVIYLLIPDCRLSVWPQVRVEIKYTVWL